MRLKVHRWSEHDLIYQAEAAVCNTCPIKVQCTPSANGRQVFRSFFESYLDEVKRYRELPAYRQAPRKRKVWMEPLFGEAKVLHGLRRFRLRGLHKVNMEGLMVAAGQNLKRLLNHRGTGKWPTLGPLALILRLPFSRRVLTPLHVRYAP